MSGWRVRFPGRARTALREAVLLTAVFWAFARLHGLVARDAAAALGNAHALQSVERRLHLNIELAANQWLAGHEAFIGPAVLVYRLYYVVLLGVLLWAFFQDADVYRQARRTLVAMVGLALLVYWAVPMSPPRFAEAGIIDIVAEHDLLSGNVFRDAPTFTAMPSLHVGYSAWAAYTFWSALRATHPRVALLAWVFPVVMIAVVFGTGNHYVLDVAGSAVLLAASIAVARGWGAIAPEQVR